MIIEATVLAKWQELRSHGDGKQIAAKNKGINDMDISRAFKLGRCADEVYAAMEKFYGEKEGGAELVLATPKIKAADKMFKALRKVDSITGLQSIAGAELVTEIKDALNAAKGK